MEWNEIKRCLPPEKPNDTIGRPIIPFRKVLDGILYVLRTGCQWKMLPKEHGSASTCHRRFQKWVGKRVFQKLLMGHVIRKTILNHAMRRLCRVVAKYMKTTTCQLLSQNFAVNSRHRHTIIICQPSDFIQFAVLLCEAHFKSVRLYGYLK